MTDAAAGGAHGAQPAAVPKSPGTAAEKALEPLELKYLRETRNAAVFIAVMVGIVLVISLVGVIIVGTHLAHASNLGGSTSSCLSQGGPDPAC